MTPPQGMSAEKIRVAYAAVLVNSYEEERDVELGVFDTSELGQKCLDEYAAEYKAKYPGEQTIWYLTPQVIVRHTIDAEDFIPMIAAARADERVKVVEERCNPMNATEYTCPHCEKPLEDDYVKHIRELNDLYIDNVIKRQQAEVATKAARSEAWQEALDAVRFNTINRHGMAMDFDGVYHVDHPESIVSAIVRNLRNGDGCWKFGEGPAERRPVEPSEGEGT